MSQKTLIEARRLLNLYLTGIGAEGPTRDLLAAKIEILVAGAMRPKWTGRHSFPDLATLTAPEFLVRVHPERVGEGRVIHKDVVRMIDFELMAAIEAYIKTRRGRGQDLGKASDLSFVTKKPARTKIPREETYKGKTKDDVFKDIRAGVRRSQRARRLKGLSGHLL